MLEGERAVEGVPLLFTLFAEAFGIGEFVTYAFMYSPIFQR